MHEGREAWVEDVTANSISCFLVHFLVVSKVGVPISSYHPVMDGVR